MRVLAAHHPSEAASHFVTIPTRKTKLLAFERKGLLTDLLKVI